jgi:hypothetical protein
MTPEPFTTRDSGFSESLGDFSQFQSSPHAHEPHYFDRPGLAWILACVLFATAAARWLPHLAEPAGMRAALVAMGLSTTASTQAMSLPQDAGTGGAARQAPVHESVTAAVFRQY